ncbi:MAG: hypothetical protein U9P38_03355 [Campylobacterota bacterium]|nr:hypothetical protein [Campylobacterota bacterium]
MVGTIMITYKILCETDLNKTVTLEELFQNEKVAKVIKSEFAKGFRNIELNSILKESAFMIETTKELHTFEVQKDDFADIFVLAEEDASNKKLFKKGCSRIELVDIETRNPT